MAFEKYGKEVKLYSNDLKLKEKHTLPFKSEAFVLWIAHSEH